MGFLVVLQSLRIRLSARGNHLSRGAQHPGSATDDGPDIRPSDLPSRVASDDLQFVAHRRRFGNRQDQAERFRPHKRSDVGRRACHRHAIGPFRLIRPQRRRMVRRLDMAAAFGVRRFGAALVVNFDYAALTEEKAYCISCLRNL